MPSLLVGALLCGVAPLTAQSGSVDLRAGLERVEIPVGDFVFDGLAAGPPDGQLVLFLHGFPQTALSYRHQLRAVGAAGYRAVAFDQRGYSPRARPPEHTAYAVPNLVSDVLGVADALGAETFHLVGHDWGGAVVWVTAAVAPGRIRSLTVLSTPHPSALASQRSDADSEQSRRSAYFSDFAAEGAERGFLENDAERLRAIYAGLDPDAVRAYLDALGSPEALRAALAWYRAAFGVPATSTGSPPATPAPAPATSTSPAAPHVAVSTVYVFGTEDGAFSWEAAEATAEHVSGPYRWVPLAGGTHWLPEQEADAVSRIVLGHLSERSGDPGGAEANLAGLRAAFSAALVAGDGEAVANAYSADAVLLPPGREIRGAERITRYFTSGRDAYRQVAHSMIPDEVRVDGTTATETGTWSSTIQRDGQDRETSTDRYLLTWRLEDGRWKIVYDMWHR